MRSDQADSTVTKDDAFRDFMSRVSPIRLREPLAAFLGALSDEGDVLEYSYTDVVRMAGHACPSVTGAFICCQEALGALYSTAEVPLRGGIAVTVYGDQDEGAYGVMSQVISFITGAASSTGFKGLAGRFVRRGLLEFDATMPDARAVSLRFTRLDNGRTALVSFMPWAIPFDSAKAERTAVLMERALTDDATTVETAEFHDLWMEKIRAMLIERRGIECWLHVEVEDASSPGS